MPRGGFREGAGRKPRSELFRNIQAEINAALPRNQSESIFSQREIKDFIKTATALALGELWKGKETKDGFNVYRQLPDARMLQFLLSTIFGPPEGKSSRRLSEARIKATMAELGTGLLEARAAQQRALAADIQMNTWQRRVSNVTLDEEKEMFQAVVMRLQHFIQRIPRETMVETYAKDDKSWQAFLQLFADEGNRAMVETFGTDEEPPDEVLDADEESEVG